MIDAEPSAPPLPTALAEVLAAQLAPDDLRAALGSCRDWRDALGACVDGAALTIDNVAVFEHRRSVQASVPAWVGQLRRTLPQLRRLRLELRASDACFGGGEDVRLVVAALLLQLPLLPLLRSLELRSRHRSGNPLPLGALAALAGSLRELHISCPHDAGELQGLCKALSQLQTLSLGGDARVSAADAARGRRLAPPPLWLPHTQYAVRHLENLTWTTHHLRCLRLTAQAAAGPAIPVVAQLTGLTCLEITPSAYETHLCTRGMEPAHLAAISSLRRLQSLTLPLPRYDAHMRTLPADSEWATALGVGLSSLTASLARLRLVVGWCPCDADLAVLRPLLAAPDRQLLSLELQLHGSFSRVAGVVGDWLANGPAWQQAGAGAEAPPAPLSASGVAFLGAVPELALLLPDDVHCMGALEPLLALPNCHHLEIAKCTVLTQAVVSPLSQAASLRALQIHEVQFTALGDSYQLLAQRGLAACLGRLPQLRTLCLTLASGEHGAHLLTDEVALALAYCSPRLQRLEWVVAQVAKKAQATAGPPAAVQHAQLTDNGVAALLALPQLETLVLHAPAVLRQAVSPSLAQRALAVGGNLRALDLCLMVDPWRAANGGGASSSSVTLGQGRGSPSSWDFVGGGGSGGDGGRRRTKHRFASKQPLLDLLPASLEELALSLPALGDASVAQLLARCPRLSHLTLRVAAGRLTRAGLARLAAAGAIKRLDLRVAPQHAFALRELAWGVAGLTHARRVTVAGAATPAGAEAVVDDDCGSSDEEDVLRELSRSSSFTWD